MATPRPITVLGPMRVPSPISAPGPITTPGPSMTCAPMLAEGSTAVCCDQAGKTGVGIEEPRRAAKACCTEAQAMAVMPARVLKRPCRLFRHEAEAGRGLRQILGRARRRRRQRRSDDPGPGAGQTGQVMNLGGAVGIGRQRRAHGLAHVTAA